MSDYNSLPATSGALESQSKARPTILFIHGSWHQPAHFDLVRNLFHQHGYPTSCPALATVNALPPTGLPDDVAVIQRELSKLVVQEHQEVIVIGHSYGGLLMTESVSEKLSARRRRAQGEDGGVKHLVYMCAFVLEAGFNTVGAFGGTMPPWILYEPNGRSRALDPANTFYHDLDPAQQAHCISLLNPIPAGNQYFVVTNPAYTYCPVTYLYCREDRAIPFAMQKMMVERVVKATGIQVREVYCDASHAVFVSDPRKILEVVEGLEAHPIA